MIGVLCGSGGDAQLGSAWSLRFCRDWGNLGWIDGRNVRIDYRWAAADADQARGYAAELVALAPDVILASSGVGSGAVAAG